MSLVFLIFLVLAGTAVQAYADDHAEKFVHQESVEITITELGEMHVKHVVRGSEEYQRIVLVAGDVSNIAVQDHSGHDVEFVEDVGGQLTLAPSEENMTIRYDLSGQLVQSEGMWMLEYHYNYATSFLIPGGAGLIFVNDNPIHLEDRRGIMCHGCDMLLEYVIDRPKSFESITWEDDEFQVETRSAASLGQFEFDQAAKSVRFNVSDADKFVTVIIPTELLGGPYVAVLGNEEVRANEYHNNSTHAWLSVQAESGGDMEIIGTTVIPEFPLTVMLIVGFAVMVLVGVTRAPFRHSVMIR